MAGFNDALGIAAARSGVEGPYAAQIAGQLSGIGGGSQESSGSQQSVGSQQSTGSQQSSSQSTSTSFIPDYSQTPILEDIAKYAESMAPQVYQHGMDQWNKNQGDIDQVMRTAQGYASGARLNADVGMAEAGQEQAGQAALDQNKQELQSYGIDPSSGRYAALDSAARIQTAANAAGAGNQQQRADIATGNAMQQQAISSELQNSAYGNQVSDTMNNLLATGESLKYSPLGTTSQSSSESSGTSQSSGTTVSSGTNQSSGSNFNDSFGGGGGGGGGAEVPGSLGYDKMVQQRETFGQPGYYGAPSGQTPMVAHGGPIGHYDDGGPTDDTPGYDPDQDGPAVHDGMSPSGGQAIDDVPAKLTAGEFVMPNDIVKWKGEEFFQKLIDQSRKARESVMAAHGQNQPGQQPQMAMGGMVKMGGNMGMYPKGSGGAGHPSRGHGGGGGGGGGGGRGGGIKQMQPMGDTSQHAPGDNIYAQSNPAFDSGEDPVMMNMGGAI